MTNHPTAEDRKTVRTSFESEPSDEWREEYGRGGPVRSNDPERDWFFESTADVADAEAQRADVRAAPPLKATPAARTGSTSPVASGPSHRGRGPKGYVPSDARLYESICERLTDDPFIDASDISVEVANRVVTLTGTVESRRMKFAAENLAASITGVVQIHNQLHVIEPSH